MCTNQTEITFFVFFFTSVKTFFVHLLLLPTVGCGFFGALSKLTPATHGRKYWQVIFINSAITLMFRVFPFGNRSVFNLMSKRACLLTFCFLLLEDILFSGYIHQDLFTVFGAAFSKLCHGLVLNGIKVQMLMASLSRVNYVITYGEPGRY